MASRFNPVKRLILLPCIIVSARCASVPQTCVQCSLSCDEAPVLEKHKSVIVLVELLSEIVYEEVCTVSSLCDGVHCSVQHCFQRDSLYNMKIYAADDERVPKVLMNKTIQPDCSPKSRPVRKYPNSADGKLSNKLLISLAFCFWIVFVLEGPR